MAMTAFELQATLGLDTSAFDSELNSVVNDVKSVESSADKLNQKPQATSGTILSNVKDDAKTAGGQLKDLEGTANRTSSVLQAVTDATRVLVEESIEGLIEYGKQSLDAASKTGSELAASFNNSRTSFEAGLDAMKIKTGESIMPLAEWMYEIGDALTGTKIEDKLAAVAQNLNELESINLDRTRESVRGMFDAFESVGTIEIGNVADMSTGLESQIEYWEKYAQTMDSLRQKGVGEDVLSQFADGSQSSLGALLALDEADATALESITASYEKLQAAQEAAAQSMSAATLPFTEEAKLISETIATLIGDHVSDLGVEGTTAGFLTQNLISDLQADYPVISQLVTQINDELGKLGINTESPILGLGKSEEGEEEPVLEAKLDLVVSDNSESDIQSTIDGMPLEGDALIKADPGSGPQLQNYLNGLNLTVTVKPKLSGGGNFSWDENTIAEKAIGMDFVPYDGYIASLHEGEAILTKLEAERWRRGEGAGATAEANVTNVTQNITVTEYEDFDEAVFRALERMRWNS